MKRPTPITAIAVSTAKPIANPIRSRLASDGLSRRLDREYACAPMADEATEQDGTVAVPEGIDKAALETWFGANVAGVDFPLAFERIAGGHSNLTYRVTDAAGQKWALRRPPMGKRLGSAHDMGREFKVVSALGKTDVPVAPVVGLCEDESVNDAPFYVMEFVEGPILRGLAEAEIFPDEGDRRAIGERVADTLVQIHAVDPDAAGLGDLGRKEDYVARQLHRWHGQWEKSKTRELEPIDRVHAALSARIPEQGPATIVHGDYRLDNMILSPSGEVAAVVDWELCTLGDPLADVGLLMAYWPERGAGDDVVALGMPANLAPGFPTQAEIAARYAEGSGRDLSDLNFYVALGYWKLAIILEGVYARYVAGGYGKVDEGIHAFARLVERLAEEAERVEQAG
jgi:aminoglycoside phosphotransferase (APT) family kinase protein